MSSQSLKIFREKLKSDGNEEKLNLYRKKQKEYDRKYMNKMLKDEKTAAEFKQKRNENLKRFRASKKPQNGSNSKSTYYSSASAKSKAMKKAEKGLPKDVKKKNEIISSLAVRHNVCTIVAEPIPVLKPRKGYKESKDIAIEFYSLDLVSKQLPGIKDFVSVKNDDGVSEKIQKRVLMMSLKDAHMLYSNMFSNHPLCFSQFCKLRPVNVVTMSTKIHYSCLCCYCENMRFLLESLAPYVDGMNFELNDVAIKFNCHHKNFKCVSSSCEECFDSKKIITELLQIDCMNNIIDYKEWMKVDGFTQKVTIENVTVRDVTEKIVKSIQHFKLHHYVKVIQQAAFHNLKQNQPSDHATLVVDFSENYATKSQNEVQASYFARKQINLFTCVAYVGQSSIESFVIANDGSSHTKEQVHAYLKKILLELQSKYNVKHVQMFSDNCAGQFKNRFILSNLLFAKDDYGVTMERHFFETSHGKSSADGLGGVIKRGVNCRVLSEAWEVYSAKDFVLCAKTFVKNVNVMEITESDIIAEQMTVQDRWKMTKSIPKTREFHFFKKSATNGFIVASISSLLDGITEVKVMK